MVVISRLMLLFQFCPACKSENILVTRATYGGTESRFTDGSVVVLVVFFLFFFQVELLQLVARARNISRSVFCNIYPQSNFFCQPGVVALAGSLSCSQT